MNGALPRAVLWDVDGTLAETERDGHRVAFNAAFAEFGLDWYWDEARYGELLRVSGGRERILADLATRDDAPPAADDREALAAALHACKGQHYERLVSNGALALRPGVRELLDDCTQAGVAMPIATTTGRANVDALCRATLGDPATQRFATVLAAEDAPLKKPDPSVYRLCLSRLGIAARDAIAMEDSPAGVAAARGAGIAVVVTRSFYFPDEPCPGALAIGPHLGTRDGWQAPVPDAGASDTTTTAGRIDLALLVRWLRAA